MKRDFTADDVSELWLTDIPPQAGGAPSEHWTDEGRLYLCAIKDVFSGRIVGYAISDRMKARLAVNALDNGICRRPGAAGCIVHSDRGSQGGFNRWMQHPLARVTVAARRTPQLETSSRGPSGDDC